MREMFARAGRKPLDDAAALAELQRLMVEGKPRAIALEVVSHRIPQAARHSFKQRLRAKLRKMHEIAIISSVDNGRLDRLPAMTTLVSASLLLPSDLLARLDAAAAADDRSRNSMARRILSAALAEVPPAPPAPARERPPQ